MNEEFENDKTIDAELQVRLMNLVMGEASDFERDQLQVLMEQRAEVAAFYEHLEHMHGLLCEVGDGDPSFDAELPNEDDSWQLSPDRRDKLLAVLEGKAKDPTANVELARSTHKSLKPLWSQRWIAALAVTAASLLLALVIYPRKKTASSIAFSMKSTEFSGGTTTTMNSEGLYWDGATTSALARSDASKTEIMGGTVLTYELPSQPQGVAQTIPLASPQPTDRISNLRADYVSPGASPSTPIPTPTTAAPDTSNGVQSQWARGELGFDRSADDEFGASRPLSKKLNDDFASGGRSDSQGGFGGGKSIDDSIKLGRTQTQAKGLHDEKGDLSGPVDVDLGMNFAGRTATNAGRTANAGFDQPSAPSGALFFQDSAHVNSPAQTAPSQPRFGNEERNLGLTFDSPKSDLDKWESSSSAAGQSPESNFTSGAAEQAKTVTADKDGTVLLGGTKRAIPSQDLNRLYKYNNRLDTTLMQTVTPRIIIPEEEEEKITGVVKPKSDQAESAQLEPPISYPNDELWRKLSARRLEGFGDVQLQSVDELGTVIVRGSKADVERTRQSGGSLEAYTVDSKEVAPELALRETFRFNDKRLQDSQTNATASEPGSGPAKLAKAPVAIDEESAAREAFSTFSLHVSDVSFKLAQTALSQGQWPEAAKIRIEEFVNALDYRDPLPCGQEKVACRVEQAIHPFLMQRNMLRVSMRTAATGRSQNTPLRLTILLDNSGSMERPDRRQAILRAFQTLGAQLKATDQVTLISFARTPRLLADKVQGNQSETLMQIIENLPSEGGTNIEAALMLAREKAAEQQLAGAQNRIVLLTDGAVNLGNANPDSLAKLVTQMRDSGIAFDAAGISAHDLNDEVLETLTRQGDGRYYLLDSAQSADKSFAAQIAGALRPSAQNVKVQVEFNPQRVGRYKLLGFEKHRLNTEDFRNDKVDAAELAAAEAGVAVYQYEIKPNGIGDVGSVSVRFRDVSSGKMIEHRWPIPYESNTPRLEQAAPSMQLATCAALFAAKLGGGPIADTVDLAKLQKLLSSLPDSVASQPRVQQLRSMVDQAIAIGR